MCLSTGIFQTRIPDTNQQGIARLGPFHQLENDTIKLLTIETPSCGGTVNMGCPYRAYLQMPLNSIKTLAGCHWY